MNCLLFRTEEDLLFLCLCFIQEALRLSLRRCLLILDCATPQGVTEKSPDRQTNHSAENDADYDAGGHGKCLSFL